MVDYVHGQEEEKKIQSNIIKSETYIDNHINIVKRVNKTKLRTNHKNKNTIVGEANLW